MFIKNEVNKIKSGLLMSLRQKFNTAKNKTTKKQIVELANNINNVEVKPYTDLEKIKILPKNQIVPKTWLAVDYKDIICIISDKGKPKYVKHFSGNITLYNVKGTQLKIDQKTKLLEPVT